MGHAPHAFFCHFIVVDFENNFDGKSFLLILEGYSI
jgi:hypothetical protein